MKRLMLATTGLLCSVASVAASDHRTYLNDRYSDRTVKRIAAAAAHWQPFPSCSERGFWRDLPERTRRLLVLDGEQYLDYVPPPIAVSDYLHVATSGDRQTIQKVQRKRRNAMMALMLAECVEYRKRFTLKVADLVWLILEESFWGSPAHLHGRRPQEVVLPDINERFVELFNADTAKDLVLVSYFMDRQLDAITPRLRQRIYHEVEQRIFRHAPARLAEFAAAVRAGKRVNNWSAWVGKNWLLCLLLLEKDGEKLRRGIRGALQMLDTYIAGFPADGSVSEGPNYWVAGSGRLFEAMRILRQLAPDIDPYDDPLIRNILEFVAKVYIGNGYFVSNADSSAKMALNPYFLAEMAVTLQSPVLARMVREFPPQAGQLEKTAKFDHFMVRQYEIFSRRQLPRAKALVVTDAFKAHTWLPGLQLLLARSEDESGFLVTAKGGHNAESHNHNDVGVFAVYLNKQPVIVDPGKRIYVMGSFTEKRYTPEHWNHTSSHHNLPSFNSVEQAAGREFRAMATTVDRTAGNIDFSADLRTAYPPEAHLEKFHRHLRLQRDGGRVVLTDDYQLATALPIEMAFMTPADVAVNQEKSRVLLSLASGERVVLGYDASQLEVKVNRMALTDRQMIGSWGQLNRVVFNSRGPVVKARWQFEFSQR